MASKALQIILILVATHAALCQDNFIGSVVQYTSDITVSENRCKATVITKWHAVTSASCALVDETKKLAIKFASSNENFAVKTVFIHPEYVKGQSKNANIAVLHIEKEFDTTLITARVLGQFPTNINGSGTTCVLQWGPTASDKGNVSLYSPESCNFGSKVFCSIAVATTDEKCSKYQGASIICGDAAETSKSVDGILLNDGKCEENGVPSTPKLIYHSIGEYREWIQKVSGAEDMKQVSSLLLVASAIFVAIKNLVY